MDIVITHPDGKRLQRLPLALFTSVLVLLILFELNVLTLIMKWEGKAGQMSACNFG